MLKIHSDYMSVINCVVKCLEHMHRELEICIPVISQSKSEPQFSSPERTSWPTKAM